MGELTREIPYVEGRHYCVDPETGCWEWAGTLLRGYAHSSGVRPHRRMSGRFVVRLPPALHEQLAAKAHEQGVSLNALVLALLAGGLGFTLDEAE